MPKKSDEANIILALQALDRTPKLSVRAAAFTYNVSKSTLLRRRAGNPARRDVQPVFKNLAELEEKTIVDYILDLATRAFPPRLGGVEDMANTLRRVRGAPPVGKNWASRFVVRTPAIRTRLVRRYEYQRAKCEDPKIIGDWFRLVHNVKAKYGILDDDIYNFDETGFMMGIIHAGMVVTSSDGRQRAKLGQPGNREWATVIQGVNATGWSIPPFIILAGKIHLSHWYTEAGLPGDWVIRTTPNGWTTNEVAIEWIQHFDVHTRRRTKGKYRLLILDGHESHHSAEFELFCKKNDIITLCMPAHSSHLLQPLDVGCFGPLKQAYGRQIEALMRCSITHISKLEFLRGFREAFFTSITPSNIQGGFQGAGLIPFDPDRVIGTLDVQIYTSSEPVIPASPPPVDVLWEPKTPQNPVETDSQTTLIRTQISQHQNSSPTPIFKALDQIAKGAKVVMHEVALLYAENSTLRKANEALSKRRRVKRQQIQVGGSLTIEDAQNRIHQRELQDQILNEARRGGNRRGIGRPRISLCRICRQPGHNARTCRIDVESSDSSLSDVESSILEGGGSDVGVDTCIIVK